MVPSTCQQCGRPVDAHDRHVRFRLPDPVLASDAGIDAAGTWLSEPDPMQAVMMQVPGLGAFVRVLLVVDLTGGHRVTFGSWLGVHPDDLQRAFAVWWTADYAGLRLEGLLANAVPPWGLLGAPASAAVTDPDATPYVVASADAELSRVLSEAWPHDVVLSALPS